MTIKADITQNDGFFTGEDQAVVWTVLDDAKAVVNVTGWTIQFKASKTEGGASSLTKSATLTTPLSGIVTVSFAAADTSTMDPGKYFYTLSRTDAGSNQVLADGEFFLRTRVA